MGGASLMQDVGAEEASDDVGTVRRAVGHSASVLRGCRAPLGLGREKTQGVRALSPHDESA
ncbi:hypothetical protein GCM10009776_23190 [Microbacterium deminutum]|uniref:Uncharacterized protein n=1 Tax=Microbacterium deminutum TaxID=344164 RepID=A0ABN2QXL3_9MICO